MMGTRPLLYFSLPAALGLIIGLIYYRRSKKSKEEKDRSNTGPKTKTITFNNDNTINKIDQNEKSKSIEVVRNLSNDNKINDYNTKLGKSAPIDIMNTSGKCLSLKLIDNNINSYEDKEYQSPSLLFKDNESYLSSVDLPDSPNKKRCSSIIFHSKYIKEEPVVVVKATVTPNLSLSNSFLENKYTEEATEIMEHEENKAKDEEKLDSNVIQTLVEHSEEASGGNLSPRTSEFSAHSGDSGKGSSLPRSDRRKIINYDFLIPASLIGKLCGRGRSHLNQVNSTCGTNIIIKKHNSSRKIKICSIKGTENEIKKALSLIRARFPIKNYPDLTLQKLEYVEPYAVVQLSLDYSSSLQLRLIEGINNDVKVVSVMCGNHIFVQHPSHPSFPSIDILQDFMNKSYETVEAPSLPEQTENAICVAKVGSLWCRVQIIKYNKDQKCLVKFLDYGGYFLVDVDCLKQIRSDFMSTPFQATECFLSDIEPIGSQWTQAALDTVCQLTVGIVLQAQIVRYSASNIPEINLYAPLSKNSVIFINKELVARGHAKWTDGHN